MATVANFAIDQGSTFSTQVNVGEGFDLTGYTARGKIRKSFAASKYVSFTTALSTFSSSTQSDFITLSIPASTSATMKAGRYVYDLELVKGSVVTRIMEGQLEILPSVSQSYSTGEGIEFSYSEENFVAHDMYHPTTGYKVTPSTYSEHIGYVDQGYVHVYPIGGGLNSPPAKSAMGEVEFYNSPTGGVSNQTGSSY